MASVTRQPFAPLDEARLQSLTSQKNRQNAVQSPAGKRKAELLDDFENLDPLLFNKRAKGTPTKDGLFKPSFTLNTTPNVRSLTSPIKATSTPRRTIQPKSPSSKLNTALPKSSPIAAPAGRSPTQGKRFGILNRRRTTGPFTRVSPPSFRSGGAAPFSLDAALKGTIPSYNSKAAAAAAAVTLEEPDAKASWFFDIHEDTPEQEATNMLQHSTCVLDISSDEESEQKARREKDEGRDKENVPPVDDVSQTSARRARLEDEMVYEKERIALGEMNTADYYPEGCDETSIVLVPGDEEQADDEDGKRQAPPQQPEQQPVPSLVGEFEFAPELKDVVQAPSLDQVPADVDVDVQFDVDTLMGKKDEEGSSGKAAVLQPMEGTGDSFELWESGSSKDEGEVVEVVSS